MKKQAEVAEEKKSEPKPDQKAINKPRPIARTPIPGTVWCVVRTDDGKCFFYDPSKRRSVWKRPEELKNRPDVDKLLSTKPEVKTEKEEVKDVEEEPPSKKIRLETEVKEVKEESNEVIKQIVLEEEAAMEDEVQEAQHRSVDSIEDRMKQFKELLTEKNISVNSTWEKELHKIACDKRYLLLTLRERRQVFDEYVKDRAEEERFQKNKKIKEKNELYRQLLEECTLNGKSTLSDFIVRCSSDKNFETIDNVCDWESIFLDYMSELAKQEQEKDSVEDKVKNDFMKMLSDILGINCSTAWLAVKSKVISDPRCKAVVKDSDRKEMFREYLKTVSDVKNDFMKMLRETRGINCSTIWSDVESKVRSDPRYIAVGKDSDRKELFKEYLMTLNNAKNGFMKMLSEIPDIKWNTNWIDMKNKVSLDPHYKAVVSNSQQEDWFREYLKTLNDAKDNFMKMLREKIGINCSPYWSGVKIPLRFNPRYRDVVSDSSRQEYFMEYLKTVKDVKNDFMKMLSEIPGINCSTIWSEVESKVRSDPRYKAVVIDSDRKKLFREYLKTVNDGTSRGIRTSGKRLTKKEVAVRDCKKFLALNVTDPGYKFSTFVTLCHQHYSFTREMPHVEMKMLYDCHLVELESNRRIIWSILDENDMSDTNFWVIAKTQTKADTRLTYFNDIQWNYEKKYAVSNHKTFLKALEDFQKLLKETKLITPETKMEIQRGTTTMRDIRLSLKEDKRYTALTCISAQRDKILFAYVDELSKENKSPPPVSSVPVKGGGSSL